jgi:hypothetical protein
MITITLAKHSSVVPVVISSPFTCQFNILTASHLYCIYPKLLSRREAVRGMAPVYVAELERVTSRGVDVVRPSSNWTLPCGEACLPVWRRTENLVGAGFMHWGGFNRVQHVYPQMIADDIEFSNHKWRLGVFCSNPACQNGRNITLI